MKKKCVVCKKSETVVMAIMDGYGDTGKFDVCKEGKCYREIVANGVTAYKNKGKP